MPPALNSLADGVEQGYKLTFKDAESRIIKDDVAQFTHIVFFAPDTKLCIGLHSSPLYGYSTKRQTCSLRSRRSTRLSPPSPPSSPLSFLLREPLSPHTSLNATRPRQLSRSSHVQRPEILSPNLPALWFSGVPQALGLNPMLVPVLNAPRQSFA
ncbi:hypothetical protein BD414DRAFT_72913 [Trametes punicea]|nr:hypothetical protein BD414DRAFT_72913 [Trametes punicea]